MSEVKNRRLAAVMFTDIKDSCVKMGLDEDNAFDLIQIHNEILREVFPQYEGNEIKTGGDSFLIEFKSAHYSVHCAIAIQKNLSEYNKTAITDKTITIRIGIHMGDVIGYHGDVFGNTVNISARTQPKSPVGSVCITDALYISVKQTKGLQFISLGKHELKGIAGQIELYEVLPRDDYEYQPPKPKQNSTSMDEPSPNKRTNCLNNIPQISVDEVIGRDDDLRNVYERLRSSRSLLLINGIGGIGKTTLAKAFLEKYRSTYDNICWISASPSFKESVLSDYVLIRNLGIKKEIKSLMEAKQSEDAYNIIVNAMSKLEGNNILVIDNTAIADSDSINTFKSALHTSWSLLITSREHIPGCNEYPIDVLNPDEAERLFLTHCKNPKDTHRLGELLKIIGYHTLTIELLAKTAAKNPKLSITSIIDLLKAHELSNKQLAIKVRSSHAENKAVEMYTHLMSIFELSLLTEDEQNMLIQFTALPVIPINVEMLFILFSVQDDQVAEFVNILNSLNEKGYLLNGSDMYQVHPIIQEIVRYKLHPDFSTYENYIDSVCNLIFIDREKDNPVEKFQFVDYATALSNILEDYEKSNSLSQEQQYRLITLRNLIGGIYHELGRYADAEYIYKKALESGIKNYGASSVGVASLQSNLALVYLELGKYSEAAAILEMALASDIKNMGKTHPTVAIRQSNLGLVYKELGKYEAAAALLEQALTNDSHNFKEDHPNIAIHKSNLANIYRDLGKYEKAAVLLEQALASDEINLGLSHPSVAITQSNLAIVYKHLGKYKEAVSLLEKALASDLKNFGESHPNIANRQSNLATVYNSLGKHEVAATLLEQALASVKKIFGESHPNVAVCQSNLAAVYTDLGKLEIASLLIEQALESDKKNFGETHPNVAIRRSNLATVYNALGKYEEAAVLFEQVLVCDKKNFGLYHPNVAICQSNLALVYQSIGRYNDAALLLEQALKSERKNYGEFHPDVATDEFNLAYIYQALGKYAAASSLLMKSLKTLTKIFGKEHPKTKKVSDYLEQIKKILKR